MPHSLSAKKRLRQNVRHRARNRWRKRRIKHQVRAFDSALHDRDVSRARAAYTEVSKILDQVAAKGTIHKNTAARRKSRLAKRLKQLEAKQS